MVFLVENASLKKTLQIEIFIRLIKTQDEQLNFMQSPQNFIVHINYELTWLPSRVRGVAEGTIIVSYTI